MDADAGAAAGDADMNVLPGTAAEAGAVEQPVKDSSGPPAAVAHDEQPCKDAVMEEAKPVIELRVQNQPPSSGTISRVPAPAAVLPAVPPQRPAAAVAAQGQAAVFVSPAPAGGRPIAGPTGQARIVPSPAAAGDGGDPSIPPPNPFPNSDLKWW